MTIENPKLRTALEDAASRIKDLGERLVKQGSQEHRPSVAKKGFRVLSLSETLRRKRRN